MKLLRKSWQSSGQHLANGVFWFCCIDPRVEPWGEVGERRWRKKRTAWAQCTGYDGDTVRNLLEVCLLDEEVTNESRNKEKRFNL